MQIQLATCCVHVVLLCNDIPGLSCYFLVHLSSMVTVHDSHCHDEESNIRLIMREERVGNRAKGKRRGRRRGNGKGRE